MTRAKRVRKFNLFQCLYRKLNTSKILGKCLHNSDLKTSLFRMLMKNPLMFEIYQVSKIKFSCPVILISFNPVKPAGISSNSNRHTYLHIFYWLTCSEKVEDPYEKMAAELCFEVVGESVPRRMKSTHKGAKA